MDRKNMAGKSKHAYTFGAKFQKHHYFFKFQFEIALNCFLDKFLNWISLNLPTEVSNAVYKMQFSIGMNF